MEEKIRPAEIKLGLMKVKANHQNDWLGKFQRTSLLAAILVVCPPPLHSAPVPEPTALKIISEQNLPAKPLRGYGILAGHFTEYASPDGRHSSRLLIQSTSPGLAAIVLAKYNSDLRELGDVTQSNLIFEKIQIPVTVTANQGAITAFRQAATVTIVAADDTADLSKLLANTELARSGQFDFVGGKVPVYLDTYDKYGFSLAYYGWKAPKDQQDTYDFLKNIAFAKKYGVTLHFQAEANATDTAEGIIDWPRFEASVDLTHQLGIPAYIGTWGKTGPGWLMNRYSDQMQTQLPDYVGSLWGPGYEPTSYGPACPIWSSEAENVMIDMLAPVVRKYSQYDNVTEFMEPFEEAPNFTPTVISEYGPGADAAYQNFLQSKYKTLKAINRRWHTSATEIKSWNEIQVPEVASFLGWGREAFDLKGSWRISQDSALSPEEQARWSGSDLDDSRWNQLAAPGDDHTKFLPGTHAPGIFRRNFNLPTARLNRLKSAGDGKIYLYVWDMECGNKKTLEAALNGVIVGHYENLTYNGSWGAFDVSTNLHAGTNLLALRLPFGELCYRIYLSPHAPRCYPDLGPGEDARWVDFRDFATWAWADCARRGMEMIRREDPNRFIRMPAPNGELDVEKALAEDYGGQFHNTGGMSGNWNDELPSLSRSSGLPFTLEPGAGAESLTMLKTFFGRWSTEGVNAVDYIPDMRDIMQDPGMLAWFDTHQPQIHLIGKYHGCRAAVAVLNGEESIHLTGFPWDKFGDELNWHNQHEPFANRRGPLAVNQVLPVPHDLILDTDFARGNADKYRVIIDDNTLIMDDQLIASIEKWVRAGGIFITYGHSGQHSPLAANTWPVSRLTGYQVTGSTKYWQIQALPGQTMLSGPIWQRKTASGQMYRYDGFGLFLKKVAPDCRDVLAWDQGKGIAFGVRPLGHGYVITDACCTGADAWPDILRWCGIPVEPVTAGLCRVGRFASNNGLDDVLVLWGENITKPSPVNLIVDGSPDRSIRDITADQTITGTPVIGGVIFSNLDMDPLETRAFLLPRHTIATAPLEWLNLQRDWWQGTRRPGPPPQLPNFPNTLDLTPECAFSPVPEKATKLTPWVAARVDDHAWKRMNLGIWSAAYPGLKRGVFRKTFEVSDQWTDGRTWLWLKGWGAFTLRPPFQAQAFLDGKLIWKSAGGRYDHIEADVSSRLKPGPHVLALVTSGTTTMNGFLGNAWLEHLPAPALSQPLAGDWGKGISLPGSACLVGARKNFVPPAGGRGKTVMFFAEGSGWIYGIYINGHSLIRPGFIQGEHFRMNLTPFIRWNDTNEIELIPHDSHPASLSNIEVRYYAPDAL